MGEETWLMVLCQATITIHYKYLCIELRMTQLNQYNNQSTSFLVLCSLSSSLLFSAHKNIRDNLDRVFAYI